jgi:pimeloyl-ACP methyl ester carboxylesterase
MHSNGKYGSVLRSLAEVAPGVKVVEIEGANHWTSMERPDAANNAISAFLDTLPKNALG